MRKSCYQLQKPENSKEVEVWLFCHKKQEISADFYGNFTEFELLKAYFDTPDTLYGQKIQKARFARIAKIISITDFSLLIFSETEIFSNRKIAMHINITARLQATFAINESSMASGCSMSFSLNFTLRAKSLETYLIFYNRLL